VDPAVACAAVGEQASLGGGQQVRQLSCKRASKSGSSNLKFGRLLCEAG